MPWGWGRTGRRTFIAAAAGAVGVALVGCESDDGPSAIPAADAAALRQVAGEALDLANRYDAAISQSPDQAARLTPIRDAHREHAAAIGRSLDASVAAAAPSPSGSAGSGGALKALAAAEKAAAERAAAACVAAASHYAPLLGAVAAARASHAEVLQ